MDTEKVSSVMISPWILFSGGVVLLVALFGAVFWAGGIQEHKSQVVAFMDEIRKKMDDIFLRLPPPNPTSSTSPIELNSIGEEISQEFSAKAWAKDIAYQHKNEIEGKREFEIYDFCVTYVNEEFNPTKEQEDRLRESAYKHGIDREKVLSVLVVELRDCLLEHVDLNAARKRAKAVN